MAQYGARPSSALGARTRSGQCGPDAVVLWGGFNLIVREHVGSPYHEAMEPGAARRPGCAPRNTSLSWAQLAIDANNGLCQVVGQTSLPPGTGRRGDPGARGHPRDAHLPDHELAPAAADAHAAGADRRAAGDCPARTSGAGFCRRPRAGRDCGRARSSPRSSPSCAGPGAQAWGVTADGVDADSCGHGFVGLLLGIACSP